MITSDRKFGVEIEFFTSNRDNLRKLYNVLNIVEDGSIRHLPYSGEYVSQILQGKSGERVVRHTCEVLKKHGASGDDPATSVHIHLDGMIGTGTLKSARKKQDTGVRQIAVSNKLKEKVSAVVVSKILRNIPLSLEDKVKFSTFGDGLTTYLSLATLSKPPRLNYTYYWLDKPDRFKWLRNVFYFYTLFSPIMEDMVSDSRRFGNMFCIPLHKSYDLDVIESTTTLDELRNVWYKGRKSTGHYDDSRYHNINLHCFWDRHGTVEIRSHGGTTDADKILLWLKLHQKIVDKLEEIELNDIKFTGDLHANFLKFIEEPLLQEYVRRLLGYYSGIKVK